VVAQCGWEAAHYADFPADCNLQYTAGTKDLAGCRRPATVKALGEPPVAGFQPAARKSRAPKGRAPRSGFSRRRLSV